MTINESNPIETNQNKPIDESTPIETNLQRKQVQCGFCEYETEEITHLKDHESTQHGVVHCNKCEYGALDKSILENHMGNHTGRINFICGQCEFESTRKAILNDHSASRHKKKENIQTHEIFSSVQWLKLATASSPIAQLNNLSKVKYIFQANYSTPMSTNYEQNLT